MEKDIYITEINTESDFLEVYNCLSKNPDYYTGKGDKNWNVLRDNYLVSFRAFKQADKLAILITNWNNKRSVFFYPIGIFIQIGDTQKKALMNKFPEALVFTKDEYLYPFTDKNKLSIF